MYVYTQEGRVACVRAVSLRTSSAVDPLPPPPLSGALRVLSLAFSLSVSLCDVVSEWSSPPFCQTPKDKIGRK